MSDDSGKEFIRDFDKCPVCGSKERFFESILNDIKDRGLLDKSIGCFDFQMRQGFALPEQKIATLPIGAEIPAFKTMWDYCSSCGMIYAKHLGRGAAKKSIDLSPGRMPNRAERRRLGGLITPQMNNSLLS